MSVCMVPSRVIPAACGCTGIGTEIPVHGEMYFRSDTYRPLVLASAGSWYPMVSVLGQEWVVMSANDVTADVSVGGGSLTAQHAGSYKASYSASYAASGNNIEYQAAVYVNGARQENIHSYRELTIAGNKTHTYNEGEVELEVGDVVDVRWSSDNAGAEVRVFSANFQLDWMHAPIV